MFFGVCVFKVTVRDKKNCSSAPLNGDITYILHFVTLLNKK